MSTEVQYPEEQDTSLVTREWLERNDWHSAIYVYGWTHWWHRGYDGISIHFRTDGSCVANWGGHYPQSIRTVTSLGDLKFLMRAMGQQWSRTDK